MTPGLRDAIHANAWFLTTTLVLVAATIAVERATRGHLVDVTVVRAFAEQFADDDPYNDGFDDEFDPTNHAAGDPRCEECRGLEARAATDREFFALVAQLEGEQA